LDWFCVFDTIISVKRRPFRAGGGCFVFPGFSLWAEIVCPFRAGGLWWLVCFPGFLSWAEIVCPFGAIVLKM